MKKQSKINLTAVMFITLISFGIITFWPRTISSMIMLSLTEEFAGNRRTITPTGFIPEIDNEPNAFQKSSIYVRGTLSESAGSSLGLPDYFMQVVSENYRLRNISQKCNQGTIEDLFYYYDTDQKIFVFGHKIKNKKMGLRTWHFEPRFYAGPNGVASKLDKSTGRFADVEVWVNKFGKTICAYDRQTKKLYYIDVFKKTVKQSRPLEKQIIGFDSVWDVRDSKIFQKWNSAYAKASPEQYKKAHPSMKKADDLVKIPDFIEPFSNDIVVVYEDGQVEMFDHQTLQSKGLLGHLVTYEGGNVINAAPDDVTAYSIRTYSKNTENGYEYRGLVAAAITRDATRLVVAKYDESGNQYRPWVTCNHDFDHVTPTSLTFPGGPALVTFRTVFENLNPFIFNAATIFTADDIAAGPAWRAMFIQPTSTAAWLVRNLNYNDAKFFKALLVFLVISPSLIIGLLCARAISKNASRTGLSKSAGWFWRITAVLFGIPALITYHITRPSYNMVTCVNCGRLRRADMDHCHNCSVPWPEAEKPIPDWQVIEPPYETTVMDKSEE